MVIEDVKDQPKTQSEQIANSEELKILAKKAKNQRKKEKRVDKEVHRNEQLQIIKESSGESLREIELTSLNSLLKPFNLKVKEVISDGHCLYRSIADQLPQSVLNEIDSNTLDITSSSLSSSNANPNDINFIKLRKIAAQYIREHGEDFAPFVGCESSNDPEFDRYCKFVFKN